MASADPPFRVSFEEAASEMLLKIGDKRHRRKIVERAEELQDSPRLGKPLVGDLKGYRSLRACGQRYRIVYRVDESATLVRVVAVGLRKEGDKKDVYTLVQKLFDRGELP